MRPVAGIADSQPLVSTAARWRLWRRWVAANVLGEVVGFGLAALAGVGTAQVIVALSGAPQIAAMVAAVVVVGGVEGSAVGFAQWLALRNALPIARRTWLVATVAGAIVAWGAGMAIGTLAGDRLEAAVSGPPLVPSLAIGAIAGTLLSLFQWPVLRRVVPNAGWWVPAHATAWAIGMVAAFAGMSALTEETALPVVALLGAATGLAMGALVAAITGIALVWLVDEVGR